MTTREDRLLAVAAKALAIVETAGEKRRDPTSPSCYVWWRDLDRLADALRELGVNVNADNLGAQAVAGLDRVNAVHRAHRTVIGNDRDRGRRGDTYYVRCLCGWERFGFEFGLQAGRAGKRHLREEVAA